MAANIYDWSLVAANNSNADADLTWAEGQAPSTVNNAARVMMQREKQLLVDIGGSLAAGGTANGLTVTAASPFAAYADGMIISFRATASNSGAATLSVNALAAKAIRKMDPTGDIALDANDIRNTGIYIAQYSAALNGAAGAWLLLNPTITLTTLTQPTLILKQSAAPTPTGEGDIQFDTNEDRIVIGDGTSQAIFGQVTPWVAYTPTFTGFGTAATIQVLSRRVGDSLEIRGRFTSGTSTAVEARMTLGFNGTNANVTSDTAKIPAITMAGVGTYSVSSASFPVVLIEPTVGYITFGNQSATAGGIQAKVTGSAFISAGGVFSFGPVTIPISGW